MRYFILLAGMSNRFEEVDKFVFDNRKNAIRDNGEQRYEEVAVTENQGTIDIIGSINKQELSVLMRILAIDKFSGSVAGGILQEGSTVMFKPSRKGANGFLWHNGQKYKAM